MRKKIGGPKPRRRQARTNEKLSFSSLRRNYLRQQALAVGEAAVTPDVRVLRLVAEAGSIGLSNVLAAGGCR